MCKSVFPYQSNSELDKRFQEVKEIYTHIQDEMSKEIFINRIILSMTEDTASLRRLLLMTEDGQLFYKFLKNNSGHIWLYGAGIRGMRLRELYEDIEIKGYIDLQKKGFIKGIKIYHPSEVIIESEDIILVTNYKGVQSIVDSICEKIKISTQRIFTVEQYNKKVINKQYFDKRVISRWGMSCEGAFVDAGCYDGSDTVKYFENMNSDAQVYAFEPDKENYKNCKTMLSDYHSVKLYQMGLGEKKTQVHFSEGEGEGSRICEEGPVSIQIDSIDHIIPQNERIDMIKMDIEGSEYNAILGAKNHIKNDAPKLAISIYHKKEDIFRIPKLLLELNPDYKFMFGHYFILGASDTVLYAYV